MNELDDADLMLAFQSGSDHAAFELLFRRHKDSLLRFLLRLARDSAIAEDVSQQTWLKVIDVARNAAYRKYTGVSFRTWLYTLARNHFVDEFKRKHAASRVEPLSEGAAEIEDAAPGLVEMVEQRDSARHLHEALLQLPFEQREVIALWAAEVEFDAIVEIVGAPRDTILSRRKYAIAKLRRALSGLYATGDRA